MKGTQLIKRTVLAGTAVACVVAGTLWGQTTQPANPAAGPSVSSPATAPGGPNVVAIVNGNPISEKWFDDMLMSVAGRRVFPQALELILVQQACGADGIAMQGPEFQEKVQAEIKRALDSFEAQGVAEKDRGRLLSILLQRNGRTEEEFLIAMNVSAGLRALSKGRVEEPTDKEIEEGFKAQYGNKVKIKLLTLKSSEDAPIVRDALEKDKDTLEHIASVHQYGLQDMTISENADQEEIKKIKDTAFGLKVHELSTFIPMEVGGKSAYYMVYLEEKIPAKNVTLAAVRADVIKAVVAIKEQNWMNAKLRFLQQNAKVDIKDPILSQQYQQIYNASTQAAATQTQPATMPK